MRTPLPLVCLVVAGCDSVFGLGPIDDPGDLDPDEPTLDAAPDAPSCTPSDMLALAAVADSYLEAPDPPHGTRPLLAVDPQRTVILKFATAGMTVTTAKLRVVHPAMLRGCATGADTCESCPAGVTGTVAVTWMRADWNEEATSTRRDGDGREWTADRASGDADRGTTTVTATYTAGQDFEVTIARTAADQRAAWASDSHVALQITTTAASAVFASREAAGDACGAAPPILELGCPTR